ncbi:hypothetical protein M1L60_00800 [Actinoplanes sp. TRM 88003]|uniref:Uncharacterized protein n=1 Tax=Paractinoplanes aksuensis TaxID=2939490 RepID=A0ABT1DE82_9ACTN|nr:hypothetical protein [Actinoplanes aksuensis]MCO8269122.1 hypothetical protein [Actinoplanes aksuensis]
MVAELVLLGIPAVVSGAVVSAVLVGLLARRGRRSAVALGTAATWLCWLAVAAFAVIRAAT